MPAAWYAAVTAAVMLPYCWKAVVLSYPPQLSTFRYSTPQAAYCAASSAWWPAMPGRPAHVRLPPRDGRGVRGDCIAASVRESRSLRGTVLLGVCCAGDACLLAGFTAHERHGGTGSDLGGDMEVPAAIWRATWRYRQRSHLPRAVYMPSCKPAALILSTVTPKPCESAVDRTGGPARHSAPTYAPMGTPWGRG